LMMHTFHFIPIIDLIAFLCMIFIWAGYTLVVDQLSWDKREFAGLCITAG